MDIIKAAGNRIKNSRAFQGCSQEELSLRANINRTFIGEIERGVKIVRRRSAKRETAALN